MANTTFSGPVNSQGGFQVITVNATYGANASVANLAASGTVILSNLPVADPNVAGQIWSNSGVLTVSAG